MVPFPKSQPAPESLAAERNKVSGSYRSADVLDRLKEDFKNKCYICEFKEPTNINVEHFIPWEQDVDLKFDWNNLFWSCGHCNNTKLAVFTGILNCTVAEDNVETALRYKFRPLPFEKVIIEVLNPSEKADKTRGLLLAVYNGTTPLKTIESANLRNQLLEEIWKFQEFLREYFSDTNTPEDREYFLIKIRGHLSRGSNFTAFKRWIIRDNDRLHREFGEFFD